MIKCVKSCIDLREINTAFCLYPVIVLSIEWRQANFPAPHQTRRRALVHRSEDGDKEDRRVRLISPRRSLAEGSRRSSYPRYIFHQYLIPFDSFYIINKVFVSCLSVQKEFYIMNIYFSFFSSSSMIFQFIKYQQNCKVMLNISVNSEDIKQADNIL